MKRLIIIIFICLAFSLLGKAQVTDIVRQTCLGAEDTDLIRSIANIGNIYYYGISVYEEGPGMTNYHGSVDAWIVSTDSTGNILWERCYGGSKGDGATKISPVNDQHLYLYNASSSTDGDVQSGNNGSGDVWIVKINNQGDIIWEQNYGGPGTEETRDAFVTPDGGMVFMARVTAAGGDVSQHYGARDIWLCRIDSTGRIVWEKTLGNQFYDNAIKLKMISDTTFMVLANFNGNGGMVMCDFMGEDPLDGTDLWLVEMDLNGNILWQSCYGGSNNDGGSDFIKTEEGYTIAASTSSTDGDVSGGGFHGGADIWILKLNNAGEIVWQKCYGGSGYEWPNYISQNIDSSYTVMGITNSNDGDVSGNHNNWGNNKRDLWMIQIDKHGELLWEHCFGSGDDENFDGFHSIVKKSDHNYIVGATSSGMADDVECQIGVYNRDAWVFEIKDCSLYAPQAPAQPAGPDTLCHTTQQHTTYQIQPALRAWDYEWQILPEEAGTITADTLNASIAWNQTYEGEVSIQARSYNDCGNSEWSEVKKTFVFNCVGVEELTAGKLQLKVYPNPAKDKVVFAFEDGSLQQNPHIIISNISGRKIAEFPVLQSKTTWDVNRVEKGMYFYTITTEAGSATGKIVILD